MFVHSSFIDLHCHSTASDGDLSPHELMERASANGVKVISLTDHDTIGGNIDASAKAAALGMHFIPGIELSCSWRSYTIHVLGLNFDLASPVIREAEVFQEDARLKRAKCISDRLVKKGLPDVLQDAIDISPTGIPGRPHFAQALIKAEVVSDFSEAFKKYLGAGKVGDVKSFWPDLERIVSWVLESGGDAVIAHPRKYNMTLTRLRELIQDFQRYGGCGIEVITSGQKQGEIGLLSDVCNRYQLKGSVGSDFHSAKYPWADLGRIPSLPKSVRPIWDDWEVASVLNS